MHATSNKLIHGCFTHNDLGPIQGKEAQQYPSVPSGAVVIKKITAKDLHSDAFAAVNPMRKAPALIDAEGHGLFEASAILNYLNVGRCFQSATTQAPPSATNKQCPTVFQIYKRMLCMD
jgi:hypothetical protein